MSLNDRTEEAIIAWQGTTAAVRSQRINNSADDTV
jgi:hypothetical protein